MNELSFIAALRMYGFRIKQENKEIKAYTATLGNGGPLKKVYTFYIRIYFHKHKKLSTPFIEITGSKISFTAYMNYKTAFEFITTQELK